MQRLCVIGSLNIDLVATAEHFPQPGETVIGKEFGTYPGGKGANQAVAAGRLGAYVSMFGKVGDDLYGNEVKLNLSKNGVKAAGLGAEGGVSTGVALIEVDATGENHIIIVPGANALVDAAYIDMHMDILLKHDIFLFQLEIPLQTVIYAMRLLKEHGKTIILDPAPARTLPDEIYKYIDYITPNQTEIAILTSGNPQTEEQFKQAAIGLLHKGTANVVLKAGKNGAFIVNKNEFTHIPGFAVNAVDTTGAGDSFNAGLAFGLAQGSGLPASVRLANAVGALSTTAKGAQGAMPSLEQVEKLIGTF